MLLMSAMMQSAIWPFHRWIISSLNSPTPVSALIHAGIVTGGGFLLARFAPLYFNTPQMLNIIFIVGLISALLGSLWKLIQHDIKRMLACSTIEQMGFIFIQCELGLFASALAHLCLHGIFKTYLFLASGSAAKGKRLDLEYNPNLICFLFSLSCGIFGNYIFATINNKNFLTSDTSLIIIGIFFIACTQLALTVLHNTSLKRLPLAIILTTIMATSYGVNIYFFDFILSPLHPMQPQQLTALNIIALIIWIGRFFGLHVHIKNTITEELYSSCPVLIKPQHTINESPASKEMCHQDHQGYQRINILKTIYQSLKYNFTTSFALVKFLGFAAGL